MADLSTMHPTALLGRPELPIDLAPARRFLRGKRVLITGAGGSVGSALAGLVLSFEPAALTLLDHHEQALFQLYRRFALNQDSGSVELLLADVRNAPKMRRLFDEARPQVVFHLAAYKHVPLGEKFPDEVFSVNVLGTRELLRMSAEFEAEAFAYPSSDKAVNPPSFYGATKRLAETLVQRVGVERGASFEVARFVNIIGTHGSVIETMGEQVERGLPLTVTDAAMARYWITMAEAVWLITSAVACGPTCGVAMLDAQDEVPVVELAQRLAAQLYSSTSPYPMVFLGLRPGERLREELLSTNERFVPGPLPGLLRVHNERRQENLERVVGLVHELETYVEQGSLATLRQRAMAAAMALQ